MTTPDVADEAGGARELLRSCHERRLEREGIPMVLALVDERGPLGIAKDAQSRGEGARYAELLETYTRLLVPPEVLAEEDEGGLITAMQVLAYAHFAPGGQA